MPALGKAGILGFQGKSLETFGEILGDIPRYPVDLQPSGHMKFIVEGAEVLKKLAFIVFSSLWGGSHGLCSWVLATSYSN